MEHTLKKALTLQEGLTEKRRYIHQNAECGFDLDNTVRFVKEELTKMGYDPQDIGDHGVLATISGPKPGKVVLLRADMDALPMMEQSGEEFASTNGSMHACGHDMHTTMLLGAAQLLMDFKDQIEGTVKLMFQPAEELLIGSLTMLEAGILENPKVDMAQALHVMSGWPIEAGKLIFMDGGPALASQDRFEIKIQGIGCHGAMPNQGVDPILAMSYIHVALNELNSREIAPGEFLVATVGDAHGGTTANIIPDTAVMHGTIRTYNNDVREMALRRLDEIAKGVGMAFRCNIEVNYTAPCNVFLNDEPLRNELLGYAKEIFNEDEICESGKIGFGKLSASEDFSFVSHEVPTSFIMIAAGMREGTVYPMHHPKVQFEDFMLYKGSALSAYNAIRWLQENK